MNLGSNWRFGISDFFKFRINVLLQAFVADLDGFVDVEISFDDLRGIDRKEAGD